MALTMDVAVAMGGSGWIMVVATEVGDNGLGYGGNSGCEEK